MLGLFAWQHRDLRIGMSLSPVLLAIRRPTRHLYSSSCWTRRARLAVAWVKCLRAATSEDKHMDIAANPKDHKLLTVNSSAVSPGSFGLAKRPECVDQIFL